MIFLSTISGESGTLPFNRREGNRKSPSASYGDFFLHSIKAAETALCNGTGLRLASVLHSSNRPRTQDRVTEISRVKKLTSLHRSANSSDRRNVHPAGTIAALQYLRGALRDPRGRSVAAQLSGVMATYVPVTFDGPQITATAPTGLVNIFDQLVNDESYSGFSNSIGSLT
jgi:hypothetical protein